MARHPPRRPDLQPRCQGAAASAGPRAAHSPSSSPAPPGLTCTARPAAPARTWERSRRGPRTLTRRAEVRSDRTGPGATPRVPPGSHRHGDSDGGSDSPGQAAAPRNNNSTAPALAPPRGQPPRAAVAAQPMAGGGRRGLRDPNQWRAGEGGAEGNPTNENGGAAAGRGVPSLWERRGGRSVLASPGGVGRVPRAWQRARWSSEGW